MDIKMREQDRRSKVMHTLVVLAAALKLKCKRRRTHQSFFFPPLKSFLKYHKSGVDNYSTRDCEIYCLSRIGYNPLEIHQKSQCCHLADTAREISEDREEDKEEAETVQYREPSVSVDLRTFRLGCNNCNSLHQQQNLYLYITLCLFFATLANVLDKLNEWN